MAASVEADSGVGFKLLLVEFGNLAWPTLWDVDVAGVRFCWSIARRAERKQNYAEVPAEFSKWVYGGGVKLPGLVTRREAERKLFLYS